MEAYKRKFDLEDRLVAFACVCLEICDLLPNTKAGNNLQYQLSRSSTSCALNYGEAQSAESDNDFIHKMKVCLKEIKETRINLRIIKEKPFLIHQKLDIAFNEVNQLIAIFLKSIATKQYNKQIKQQQEL